MCYACFVMIVRLILLRLCNLVCDECEEAACWCFADGFWDMVCRNLPVVMFVSVAPGRVDLPLNSCFDVNLGD